MEDNSTNHYHHISFPSQVLHTEIKARQNPILQALQDTQQILRQNAQTLRPEDQTKLTEKQTELRNRYEALSAESHSRTNKLSFADEDLPKLEEELSDFEKWLREAEKALSASLKNKDKSADGLKKQYAQQKTFNEDVVAHGADIKFVVKGCQKHLDAAKVMFLFFTVCMILQDFLLQFQDF